MKRLELEGERKRREERKRNIISKEVKVKKVGPEGLREEIEGIVCEGDMCVEGSKN